MEAILKKKLTLPNYLTASAKDLIIRVYTNYIILFYFILFYLFIYYQTNIYKIYKNYYKAFKEKSCY